MRQLVPVLALAALGSAAGAAPASCLGHKVDPAGTAFCRTHGCTLVEVRRNSEDTMGWHGGTQRSYRLKDDSRVEVDMHPHGWLRNARLFTKGQPQPGGMYAMEPAHYPLAAELLRVVTGRQFSTVAVAACERVSP